MTASRSGAVTAGQNTARRLSQRRRRCTSEPGVSGAAQPRSATPGAGCPQEARNPDGVLQLQLVARTAPWPIRPLDLTTQMSGLRRVTASRSRGGPSVKYAHIDGTISATTSGAHIARFSPHRVSQRVHVVIQQTRLAGRSFHCSSVVAALDLRAEGGVRALLLVVLASTSGDAGLLTAPPSPGMGHSLLAAHGKPRA